MGRRGTRGGRGREGDVRVVKLVDVVVGSGEVGPVDVVELGPVDDGLWGGEGSGGDGKCDGGKGGRHYPTRLTVSSG